jgi:hypothetical protein
VLQRKHDPLPRFDIGEVLTYLGAEVPQSRRSGWQKMSCFLHDDRNPSATVNFDLGRFWCWSCGENNDGVGLIQSVEQCDFKSALATAWAASPSTPREGDGGVPGRAIGRTEFGLFE